MPGGPGGIAHVDEEFGDSMMVNADESFHFGIAKHLRIVNATDPFYEIGAS